MIRKKGSVSTAGSRVQNARGDRRADDGRPLRSQGLENGDAECQRGEDMRQLGRAARDRGAQIHVPNHMSRQYRGPWIGSAESTG